MTTTHFFDGLCATSTAVRATPRPTRAKAPACCKPPLFASHYETLERRQLLHGGHGIDPIVPNVPTGPAINVPLNPGKGGAPTTNLDFSVLPWTITGITTTGTGATTQLVAQAKIGDTAFQIPLELDGTAAQQAGECDILNLEIGAINLDLLGLVVETSDICLDIVAQEGGGLLGDLLCDVAGLLDGGLNLGDILGDLSPEQITALFNGLTDLLTGVLDAIGSAENVTGVTDSITTLHHGGGQGGGQGGGKGGGNGNGGPAAGECDILNLAIGPVDLNLLGLNVHLDNCEGGPVTVDITAERGPGNLLGNLLCGLTRILDGQGGGNGGLARQLDRIADTIEQLA